MVLIGKVVESFVRVSHELSESSVNAAVLVSRFLQHGGEDDDIVHCFMLEEVRLVKHHVGVHN